MASSYVNMAEWTYKTPQPVNDATWRTWDPDSPLQVFFSSLQVKQDHTNGSHRLHHSLPPPAQPILNRKPLSHLELILEACRITIDACRDALVYFKGQFNFDAFGLNSFLISRNCSQFSWCQLLALYTSPLPACCAVASLSLMIMLFVRLGRGRKRKGCFCRRPAQAGAWVSWRRVLGQMKEVEIED